MNRVTDCTTAAAADSPLTGPSGVQHHRAELGGHRSFQKSKGVAQRSSRCHPTEKWMNARLDLGALSKVVNLIF